MRAEQVTGPVAYHGEGPVWSERWGGLRWVDMLAGDILSLTNEGTIERRHVDTVTAALRPRRRGGAVIGVERGFALEDADGTLTYLGELWTDTNVRMNEGGCDPDGRFYCGSMANDQRDADRERVDGDQPHQREQPHAGQDGQHHPKDDGENPEEEQDPLARDLAPQRDGRDDLPRRR